MSITVRLCTGALLCAVVLCGQAYAAPRPPDGDLTFACDFLGDCPRKTVPGGADRDVHPFAGSLGRPCGWRQRPTPQGPRRLRVCY